MSKIIKDKRSIGKFTIRQMHSIQTNQGKQQPKQYLPLASTIKKHPLTLSPQRLYQNPITPIKSYQQKSTPYKKIQINPQKYSPFVNKNPNKSLRYSTKKVKDNNKMDSSLGRFYNPSNQSIDVYGKIKHQFDSPNKSFTYRNKNVHIPIKIYQYGLTEPTSETPKIMDQSTTEGTSTTKETKITLPSCNCDENPIVSMQKSKIKQFQIVLKDQGEKMVFCRRFQLNPKEKFQAERDNSVPLIVCDYSIKDNEKIIGLNTKVSQIKKILIEQITHFKPQFCVPKIFLTKIRPQISQSQIHRASYEIFAKMLGFQPQLVSLKRLGNCIKLMAKTPQIKHTDIALIWYFNGSFYLGAWHSQNQSQQKSGIGLQYITQQSVYYGEYDSNQKHGYGIMMQPTGQVYIGEWKKGERCGWGKVFNRCGILVVDGDFHQNMLVSNRKKLDQ